MVLDHQGLYPETMSLAQWHADSLDMHRRHFPLLGGPIGYRADVLRLHFEHACAATQAIKTGDTSGLGAAKQTPWRHWTWHGGCSVSYLINVNGL